MNRAALVGFALLFASVNAQANAGFTHVVRAGDTLASIAERYYGDPRRETVLVAENGLNVEGGQAIVVGLHLRIPRVSYHTVKPKQTWQRLAQKYFGDQKRAFILAEMNNKNIVEQPAEGTEILIPYPLRHIAKQNENIPRIAKQYFGTDLNAARLLRRFNNMRFNRVTRGQIVLVPLGDLVLSEDGRKAIAEVTGKAPAAGDIKALQERISADLPILREHIRRGRFAEAVSLGNRLLGAKTLTGNQIVTIQRELGTAFVALGRTDLAISAFRGAIDRQPDLELDTVRTSPVVMRAFRTAKDNKPPAPENVADGGVADGGPDGGKDAASGDN